MSCSPAGCSTRGRWHDVANNMRPCAAIAAAHAIASTLSGWAPSPARSSAPEEDKLIKLGRGRHVPNDSAGGERCDPRRGLDRSRCPSPDFVTGLKKMRGRGEHWCSTVRQTNGFGWRFGATGQATRSMHLELEESRGPVDAVQSKDGWMIVVTR